MRLYIKHSNDSSIFVSGGYVIVSYPMNISINEFLEMNKQYLINLTNDSYECCHSWAKPVIEKFSKLLNSNNNIINCFEKIELDYPIEEVVSTKLDTLFTKTDTPVIINAKEIDDTFLLENISTLDNILKENGISQVSYIIKQCVAQEEAHGIDVSYSLDDVLLVLNYIKDLTSNIKKFNFSPLEQIMYIYDLVKDKYYKEELEYEDYLESRDIARILKGDRIVCLGFSYLFKSLLDSVNIPNELSFINGVNSDIGHARVFIGIEDPKYNLNQVLYFDPTWDSKRKKDNINLLDRYNHFARNKKYFINKDKTKGLIDEEYLSFDISKNNGYLYGDDAKECLRQIYILFKMINWEKYFSNIEMSESYRNELNKFMNIDLVDLYDPEDNSFIYFIYKECCKMLESGLSSNSFLECLTNVRRIENHLRPDKFNFNSDRLIEITNEYISNEKKYINLLELNNENPKNESLILFKKYFG